MFLWFLQLEQKLSEIWGYRLVVHIEDFLLFAGSFSLGMMVMAVLSGSALSKIRTVRQSSLNKIKLLNLQDGEKKEYIINANSKGEFIETLLIIIFKRFFPSKKYALKNEKKTKRLIIIFEIIGFILIILAFFSIFSVFEPNVNYFQ